MTAQEKAWKVIRGLGEFSMAEVVVLTEANGPAVMGYIGQLRKCGYVRMTGKRKGPNGKREKVFRLIKNTGPMPPRWTGALFDPNTNSIVGGCRDGLD